MTIHRWISLVLILALLTGLALTGWVSTCRAAKGAQEAAQVAVEVREIDARVSVKAAKRDAKLQVVQDKRSATVERALDEAPDWASQPMPPEVLSAVR